MENIDSILEQLHQYDPENKCTVPIEKWALIRAADTDDRLNAPNVVDRLALVADLERHLNLAAHYEQSGISVIYRGELARIARLIAAYPDEVACLCGLRKTAMRRAD